MFKSKLRLLGVSALVGTGLLAAGPVGAYNVSLGGVDIQIDTTMSVGATWQMKESDKKFLPESNGGPAEVDPNFDFVRDANGAIKYYDPSILDADDAPAYLSSTTSVRETALVTVGDDNSGSERVANDVTKMPDGAKPVLDYNGATAVNNCTPSFGGFCQAAPAGNKYNFDGSINTDDGRLNFDEGDAVSAPIKFTTDVELNRGALQGFFRIRAFYDAVLMDDENFNRGGDLTDDGEELAGANIEMLDAFVGYDFDLANMPATVRVGKQVINWGEATFIPGGNSAFNPIDVPAIRRPGAEIKEALLPVEAIYGSLAITDTLSVEAYYGGWERYKLDVGGTFFAGSDSAEPGHTGGSPEDHFFVGGGPKSGKQWVCDTTGYQAGNLTGFMLYTAMDAAWSKDPCAGSENADLFSDYTVGSAEAEREAIMPGEGIGRLADDDGDESLGLAIRYYAENLNSTEFGFYYQKTDSRLPYVSYVVNPTTLAPGVTGGKASQVTRGAGIAGCMANVAAGVNKYVEYTLDEDATTDPAEVVFDFASPHYRPDSGDTTISDPDGLVAAMDSAIVIVHPDAGTLLGVDGVLGFAGGALGGLFAEAAVVAEIEAARKEADDDAVPFVVGVGEMMQFVANGGAGTEANEDRFGKGVVVYESNEDLIVAYDDAQSNTAMKDLVDTTRATIAGQAGTVWGDAEAGTIAAVQQANCAAGLMQAFGQNLSLTGGHPFDSRGQLATGAITLGYSQDLDLYLEHPEVETYGMSFNTVIAGWGVQGDFTYRPDAPLQIDTDVLTIAGLFQQCAAIGASGVEYAYMGLENYNHEFLGSETGGCTPTSQTLRGYVEHDVITWDIGTTATFTRSNPVIAALGADIGILLTEFQGLNVDGAEDRATPATTLNKVPLSNVCTSGSDLALNSVLNIDARAPKTCRPTDDSMGMVLLARATWNNVLGTPVSLSPTVVARRGLDGYSPSPLGSWKEGVGSVAYSVGFDYLGQLSGSVNYVTYQGQSLYTKNADREHLSVNLSYAF
jgi:hypothetical protein